MKREAIVETRFRQFHKIRYGAWCIVVEKVNVDVAFVGFDNGFAHSLSFFGNVFQDELVERSSVLLDFRLHVLLELTHHLFCQFTNRFGTSRPERL